MATLTVGALREILDNYNDNKEIHFTYDLGGEAERAFAVEDAGTGYADDDDGDRAEVVMLLGFSE